MSYSELHQSLVGVLSQHCWCSYLLPAEVEMKLHSISLCSHFKSIKKIKNQIKIKTNGHILPVVIILQGGLLY